MTSALMPFDSLLSDERDANPDLAAATLNPDLLQAVPQPVRPSLAELRQALEQQKVVVVRIGSGLSWQSLFSTASAILLHIALIGGVILLSHLTLSDVVSGSGKSGLARDGGGKGHGVVGGFVIGAGEPRPGGTTISPKPAAIPEPVKTVVAPAPVTPVPQPTPTPNVQALQDKLTSSEVVGLATKPLAAKPAETQPVHPQTAATTPPPLMFAPPPPTAKTTAAAPASAVASVTGAGGHKQLGGGGAGGAGRGGSRLGQGPGLNDEDDEGYDLMKSGSGGGSGKNRGASAADQNVKILDVNPFLGVQEQLSNRMRVKLSGKMIQVQILVKADGSVGDVKILKSSGIDEVDVMVVEGARRSKFMPAMRGGRAIDNTYDMSLEF